MKIRAFKEQDRKEVIKLWKDCNLVIPQNNPNKDIDRKLLVDSDLFLVAVLNDAIVATVMGGYDGHIRDTNDQVLVFYNAIGYGNDNIIGLGKRFEDDSLEI